MEGDQPEPEFVAASAKAPASLTRKVSNISMPKEQSGWFGTASNLVNAIVGAGIIGIPYAISKSGIVAGVFMLILVAYLTDKSLRMVVELAYFHPRIGKLGVLTYEDLASIPFGRFGSRFVSMVMVILAYGAMVAYLLVIKDTVPVILNTAETDEGSFLEREVVMIVTSFVIILPLSLLRDMASLAKTSFLSVLADVFLTTFVVVYSPVPSTVEEAGGIGEVLKDNLSSDNLFVGLGVLTFALACQHSVFNVSNSMENKTPSRWSMVTFRSVATASILLLLVGVFGFLGFLDDTKGNILNNFDSDSVMANAGRVLLAMTMCFTYPMEMFVARHVVVMWIYNGDMDGTTVGPDGETVELPRFMGILNRRHVVTLGIYAATLLPALFVDDLGPVLSITGAVGASCIAFVSPGMLYLGINGESFLVYCGELLEKRGYKENKTLKPTVPKLPVDGDASAKAEDMTAKSDPANQNFDLPSGVKPWWWYLMGFPVWVSIARRGATGTRIFLQQLLQGQEQEQPLVTANLGDEDVAPTLQHDYYMSMFMIVFGIVAAVMGVLSNIYMEANEVR